MNTCIFCDIVAKKIPSDIVFEDDVVLAFLDIHPTNPGHTLVVPKQHVATMAEASSELASALAARLPRLTRAVQAASKADGYNVNNNNGTAAGQVVSHLHLHIIPRFSNDGYQAWGHRSYADGEAAQVAAAIREALA